jgi:predicted metalloenzyme YecM
MTYTLETFLAAAQPSINAFNEWVATNEPNAKADHICYKSESAEEFESLLKLFQFDSSYIYQSIISKRRIAIIKFAKPILTDLGDIWFMELSDQKPDSSQVSGYDHIEVYSIEGNAESLASELEFMRGIEWEKVVRPHHTTYDLEIFGNFKVRLEDEPLVNKIKRDEMI